MNRGASWVNIRGLLFEYLSAPKLLAVYFIINSIGLIFFSMIVASALAKFAQPSMNLYVDLYPWARPPEGSIGKLSSFLQYVLPVLALFIYYSIFVHLSKFVNNFKGILDKERKQKVEFYFIVTVVINGILLFVGHGQKIILGILLIQWLFLFIWVPYSVIKNLMFNISISNRFLGVGLCVVLIQYAAIFVPLIIKPFEIENDYINISEKTLLKSGKVVDNLDYINEHKLAGLRLRDPRNPKANILDSKVVSNQSASIQSVPPFLFSTETQDFLNKNKVEMINQARAGWFFYHHNYNFGPMNALSLGASAYKQTMVYGWLNTVTQSKALDWIGASNYQGYFKMYFAEYLVYFGIFIWGIWAIFKRLGTVVFAAIMVISALFFLGIELIRLAPGFNPVRHLFDVPVFYLLYRYLVQNRKIHLVLACILALFAILWCKDFGLFLSLSVAGAVLFKSIKQRPFQFMPLFMGGITAISGMMLYLFPLPGANPTAMYMFLGVGAPIASSGDVFGLLIIVSLLLAATIAIRQSEAYMILAVGVALYFAQSLTYYIWYPQFHHILGIAPVFILWLVVLFHGWISQAKDEGGRQSIVLTILVVFVYLPASVSFYWGQSAYNQTFKNHQLFYWPFEKAHLVSTMEPALFEESVNLIKRYSANNNGIFIISKFDHILPILASKYSAMPYNELPTNLASPREVKVASEFILKNKPAFLFVDSDIGLALNGEIPNESDPVTIQLGSFGEARARVMVLQGLNEVYIRVASKYERCEAGRLISVYCRKSD
jgi:hypothetical protein